jgi:hypothetical protein
MMLMVSSPTAEAYAENMARAVRAAEPMAKPLPIAAVVFPNESRPSVIALTSGPSSDSSQRYHQRCQR